MVNRFSKDKIWDYLILSARILLAWTFLRYGVSKLMGGQFGITDAEMATELKDLSLFKLSWYLFEQEPFNSFVGISQILCAVLLVINRTTLIGAFLFLPIVSTILIIDLTFMPPVLAEGFAWRLSFYIFLDLLILWHYKGRMKIIWDAVFNNVSTKHKFSVWGYLLLPLFAIGLELVGIIPQLVTGLVLNPTETIDQLMEIPQLIGKLINSFSS